LITGDEYEGIRMEIAGINVINGDHWY